MSKLKEMVEKNLDLAKKIRGDGHEVEAYLSVKSRTRDKVDIMNVSQLTNDKNALSEFIKKIGALPDVEAIVFMSEAWMTEIDKETMKPTKRVEILSILGEDDSGHGIAVKAPIESGTLGEAEWTDITDNTQYEGRLANFFSERQTNKDWEFYIR